MITKEQASYIKKHILLGVPAHQIAKDLGISKTTVYAYSEKERQLINTSRAKRNAEMQSLYKEGWSRDALAEKYNVSKGTVGLVCKGLRERDYCGDANPAWRGGVTTVQQKIRKSDKYAAWRLAVFERDGYTCQLTNKQSNKLVADHIKPFALILEEHNITTLPEAYECDELWDTDNGRTLTYEAHLKTDTYGALTTKLLSQMSTRQPNNRKI